MSITYFLTDPTVSWTYETFYTPIILPFRTVGTHSLTVCTGTPHTRTKPFLLTLAHSYS